MACVDIGQLIGSGIEDADKGGDKEFFFVVFVQAVIYQFSYLGYGEFQHHIVFYMGFCQGHKQGGRNAFSGNIGGQEAEPGFVNKKYIVKIAAHALGGLHPRGNLHVGKFAEAGKGFGEKTGLDTGCDFNFGFQAFPLGDNYGRLGVKQFQKGGVDFSVGIGNLQKQASGDIGADYRSDGTDRCFADTVFD